MDLIDLLGQEWVQRALLTTSLVGITCGVIGVFIVLRNMSLIGDALSHAILPGIFLAYIIVGYSTIAFFMGSVFAGVVSAILITWIQQFIKTKNDAAIGIVFTVMFSLGVIGISWLNNQSGAHLDLKDFLFGNVLGINDEDIIISALVCLYTLASVVIFYRYLFISTFQETIAQTMGVNVKFIHYFLMLLLSFAVVSALRAVGVILVVAMLITPASSALLLTNKLNKAILISGFLGMLASVIGLFVSIPTKTPPGPAMVVVSTIIYFIVAMLAPEKGVLVRYYRRRKQANEIAQEDILYLFTETEATMSVQQISTQLGMANDKLSTTIDQMTKDGFISSDQDGFTLTNKGKEAAKSLVY